MALDVHIETIDMESHPDWKSRGNGDREFWQICEGLEFQDWQPDGFPYESDRVLYRPSDFAAFRAAPWPDQWARERYHKAADIMESDPKWWLYFSR